MNDLPEKLMNIKFSEFMSVITPPLVSGLGAGDQGARWLMYEEEIANCQIYLVVKVVNLLLQVKKGSIEVEMKN